MNQHAAAGSAGHQQPQPLPQGGGLVLVPQSEFRNAACSLHRICLSLPPGLLQGVQGRMKRQTLQRINKNERVFSLNYEGYVKEFLTKREKIVHLRPKSAPV